MLCGLSPVGLDFNLFISLSHSLLPPRSVNCHSFSDPLYIYILPSPCERKATAAPFSPLVSFLCAGQLWPLFSSSLSLTMPPRLTCNEEHLSAAARITIAHTAPCQLLGAFSFLGVPLEIYHCSLFLSDSHADCLSAIKCKLLQRGCLVAPVLRSVRCVATINTTRYIPTCIPTAVSNRDVWHGISTPIHTIYIYVHWPCSLQYML